MDSNSLPLNSTEQTHFALPVLLEHRRFLSRANPVATLTFACLQLELEPSDLQSELTLLIVYKTRRVQKKQSVLWQAIWSVLILTIIV